MYRDVNKNMQMSLEAKFFVQHKFSQRWRENLNNSWFHTLLEDIIFLNGYFKTQNLASLLLGFFSVGFSMHKKGAESSFLCPALFSGEFTMSETWADTTLPTLPFNALIAQCFGTVRAPSPVVIITVTWKRSAVSDWHSKWPFCQRGDTDTSSPGRHTFKAITI